ncbi:MAG: helix-turn-helix domain-containing protein [Planctomycetaceae bacterium]
MPKSRKSIADYESPSERLLNVADVAEQLSISQSLVYQIVDAGKIPFLRIGIGRGSIRFQSADIKTYLDSCRVEKVAAQPSRMRLRLKHIRLKND